MIRIISMLNLDTAQTAVNALGKGLKVYNNTDEDVPFYAPGYMIEEDGKDTHVFVRMNLLNNYLSERVQQVD